MIRLARNLNRSFDPAYARARLGELDIPLDRKAAKLSGGQRAQLALTLALAKRPRLLILDEPLAALDPLARHDFIGTVLYWPFQGIEGGGLLVLAILLVAATIWLVHRRAA